MFDVYFKSYSYLEGKSNINDFSQPVMPSKITFDNLSLDENFMIVSIHTDTKPDKMCSTDQFIELIEGIISSSENIIIVILGIPKFDFSFISDRILQLNSTDFDVSWQLLNLSNYFIGVDSCFLHIADINKIPSIGLFGPTNESEWGFRFNNCSHIIKGTDGKMEKIDMTNVLKYFRNNTLVL